MRCFAIFLLLLFCCASGAFAQSCDCAADLEFTAELTARKHPGFRYMTRGKRGKRYADGLADLRREVTATADLSRDSCLNLLNRYFLLLDDKHIQVKASARADTLAADRPHPDFSYEALNDQTALLSMPTFSKLYATSIDSFYRSLPQRLGLHPRLLIDLRNNTGGSRNQVLKLVDLIRAARGKLDRIALLQNDYCASGCEHFLYWLPKKMSGVTIRSFGTNSYGALAYGGTRDYMTPHCRLHFRLPRQTFRYLRRYERVGIAPDVPLPTTLEWNPLARQWLEHR